MNINIVDFSSSKQCHNCSQSNYSISHKIQTQPNNYVHNLSNTQSSSQRIPLQQFIHTKIKTNPLYILLSQANKSKYNQQASYRNSKADSQNNEVYKYQQFKKQNIKLKTTGNTQRGYNNSVQKYRFNKQENSKCSSTEKSKKSKDSYEQSQSSISKDKKASAGNQNSHIIETLRIQDIIQANYEDGREKINKYHPSFASFGEQEIQQKLEFYYSEIQRCIEEEQQLLDLINLNHRKREEYKNQIKRLIKPMHGQERPEWLNNLIEENDRKLNVFMTFGNSIQQ